MKNNLALIVVAFLLINTLSFANQPDSVDFKKVDSLNSLFFELDKTELAKSKESAEESLKLARELAYEKGIVQALANLGSIEIRTGNNQKAIEYFLQALKAFSNEEEAKKDILYANILSRLAGAFYFSGQLDKGILYGTQALVLAKKFGKGNVMGLAHRIIGESYRDKGLLDSGLVHFNKGLEIFKELDNPIQMASIYVDMGVLHYYKKEYQQAIVFTKLALSIYYKLGQTNEYVVCYHNLGEFYYLIHKNELAKIYLDSAQQNGEKHGHFRVLLDTYGVKARLFQRLKMTDSVSYYYEKIISIKDNLYNDTYNKEMARAQSELELFRHESENKILQQDKRIAELYLNLALACVVVFGFLLGMFFFKQKLKVQKVVKSRLENEVLLRTIEIEAQKKDIEQANLRLQLSLNRAKVDPHFIFNVLSSIQHIVLEKKPEEAQGHLAKLSRLMRYVLEKSSLQIVRLADELKILEYYIQLEQLRVDYKFQYEIINRAHRDVQIPAMLLQPYVENAVLHGLAPSNKGNLKLLLKTELVGGSLKINIEDNGMGRPHLSQLSKMHHSVGSQLGKNRLDILSKLEQRSYTLDILDLTDSQGLPIGTRIEILIPIEKLELAYL